MMNYSESIRKHAARLGFDACGIASIETIDPAGRFNTWLQQGFHAQMHWLEKTAAIRLDIRRKLPGAQSVVVVARNYYATRPPLSPNAVRVSRYAWGEDYHYVLQGPLEDLATYIRSLAPEIRTFTSVDSGPVLEKFWAAKAGVGWIGKNSLVIREGLGSWFFLGCIVTTLPLEPDCVLESRCGECRACIEACPTGAIIEAGVVDARRCISYQTVENRHDLDSDVAKHLDPWVFGCDICQEVCPWNRDSKKTSEQRFKPIPGHANPDPYQLLTLSAESFAREFIHTPILRAGLGGIRRNVLKILENRGQFIPLPQASDGASGKEPPSKSPQ